jgi:hypothetical protein
VTFQTNNDVVPDGGFVAPKWPPPFEPYGKTPRWRSQCIVTEKLDGTNSLVQIHEDPSMPLAIGSRNRWLSVTEKKADNYGFAAWVLANEEAIRRLGPGKHYGEWWGCGIGRGYGLAERRWSLFQATRWTDEQLREMGLPANVSVVPILARGELLPEGPEATDTGGVSDPVRAGIEMLRLRGSVAAPGYNKPEGVIVALAAMGFKPMKYVFENKVGPSPEEGA